MCLDVQNQAAHYDMGTRGESIIRLTDVQQNTIDCDCFQTIPRDHFFIVVVGSLKIRARDEVFHIQL